MGENAFKSLQTEFTDGLEVGLSESSSTYHAIYELKRLSTSIFRALLESHNADLRLAGLQADALFSASTLWEVRAQLPERLLETIDAIHHMADEVGRDQLLACLRRHHQPIPEGALPLELSANVRVNRPDLFHQALIRRSVAPNRSFHLLVGRSAGPARWKGPSMQRIEAELGSYFEHHLLGEYCRIQTWRERDLQQLLVHRGRGRRADHGIYEDQVITYNWVPELQELAVYDERLGRLELGVDNSLARQAYRRAFGALLFDDPEWFRPQPVVRLDPLLHDEQALSPTRGLLDVRLVELEIVVHGPKGGTLTAHSEDALGSLRHRGLMASEPEDLRSARFELLHADGSWRSVSLTPPYQLTRDWQRNGSVARQFLEERGYLAGPAGWRG